MKNVFVYLRISTEQQLAGDGFVRQLDACQKYCEMKQWTIVRVFKEQVSGSEKPKDRDVMCEMLESLGNPPGVKTIVVEHVDRIARDVIASELFFQDCKKLGVEVYSANTDDELVMASADPTRILIRQLLAAIAEYDRAQIIKKLQAARRRKSAETGKPCGGPRPYGEHKEPLLREREQEVLNIILTKKYADRWSEERIAEWLTGKYPNPSGGPIWSTSTVYFLVNRNSQSALAGRIRKEVV